MDSNSKTGNAAERLKVSLSCWRAIRERTNSEIGFALGPYRPILKGTLIVFNFFMFFLIHGVENANGKDVLVFFTQM